MYLSKLAACKTVVGEGIRSIMFSIRNIYQINQYEIKKLSKHLKLNTVISYLRHCCMKGSGEQDEEELKELNTRHKP